jgi:hypothetical protein
VKVRPQRRRPFPENPGYALTIQEDQALKQLDGAERAIEKATTILEAKDIIGSMRAAQVWAKRMKKGPQVIAKAIGYQLRAERRLGEILKGMKERGERHAGSGDQKSESQKGIPKLEDLGVTAKESSRAQQLADLPGPEFDECVQFAQGRLTIQAALDLLEEKRETDSRKEEGLAALIAFKIALTHLRNGTSDFFDMDSITYGQAVRLIHGSDGFNEGITRVMEATPWAEVDTILMEIVRKAIRSQGKGDSEEGGAQ